MGKIEVEKSLCEIHAVEMFALLKKLVHEVYFDGNEVCIPSAVYKLVSAKTVELDNKISITCSLEIKRIADEEAKRNI